MEIDNLNRQKHYFDSTELMFPVLTQSLIGLSLPLQKSEKDKHLTRVSWQSVIYLVEMDIQNTMLL